MLKAYGGVETYLHELLTFSLHGKRLIILTFRPLFSRGNRPRCILDRLVGGTQSRASSDSQKKKESMLPSGIEIRCQLLPWQSYPTLLRRHSIACNSLKFYTQNRRCNVANQLIWFPHLHNVNCQETNQGGEVTVKLLFYPNPLSSNRSIRGP
jgi:hypothetical protein